MLEKHLHTLFPNVAALRMFLTIPPTVASGERSFSHLKYIKNCRRTATTQKRLNALAQLHINSDIAKHVDFDGIITEFAKAKARKCFAGKSV